MCSEIETLHLRCIFSDMISGVWQAVVLAFFCFIVHGEKSFCGGMSCECLSSDAVLCMFC